MSQKSKGNCVYFQSYAQIVDNSWISPAYYVEKVKKQILWEK